MTRAKRSRSQPDIENRERLGTTILYESVIRPDGTTFRVDASEDLIAYDTRLVIVDALKPECLDRFLALEQASAQDICEFAKAYGVLRIHSDQNEGPRAEGCDEWRLTARRAAATVRIAAAVQTLDVPDAGDWESLRGWWWWDGPKFQERMEGARPAYEVARARLEGILSSWLVKAQLQPRFFWKGTFGSVVLRNVHGTEDGVTLLGGLAQQLIKVATLRKAIATCSSCGRVYTRLRIAAVSKRNYCEPCGKRAAWRDAQAARRARVAKKGRTR